MVEGRSARSKDVVLPVLRPEVGEGHGVLEVDGEFLGVGENGLLQRQPRVVLHWTPGGDLTPAHKHQYHCLKDNQLWLSHLVEFHELVKDFRNIALNTPPSYLLGQNVGVCCLTAGVVCISRHAVACRNIV